MATKLKDILHSFLETKQNDILKQKKLEKEIKKTLSEELQKHIIFKGVRKDKLVFCVDSSVAHYQINLVKKDILKQVSKNFENITGLVIEIGDIKNG